MIYRLSLSIITFLLSVQASAQIGVGPIAIQKGHYVEKFEPSDLDDLSNTTTVFVYRKADEPNAELWKKELKKVWTYTELIFVSYDKIRSYINKKDYSFLMLAGHITKRGNTVNSHFYLQLFMNSKDKKGRPERQSFARIDLYPSFETYQKVVGGKKVEASMRYLYNEAELRNWHLGFIKNYLRVVNDHLLQEQTRDLFLKNSDQETLQTLKTDTLYIPDEVLIKFGAFNGNEDKRHDKAQLFKSYKYPYKILPSKELAEKIINDTAPFHYLVYVKSSTDVFLTIFNSQTSDIIYSQYNPVSYNVGSYDIGAIAKAMIVKEKKKKKKK